MKKFLVLSDPAILVLPFHLKKDSFHSVPGSVNVSLAHLLFRLAQELSENLVHPRLFFPE
jgi:hypothetical protein